MKPIPNQPRCAHVSHLSFDHLVAGTVTAASRPVPCRADAAHVVDGRHYRCADHLVALFDGEHGARWEVRRLDAPLGRGIDDVLTAAGAPCTLDRFQEWHASDAARIGLIAAQRDQLKAAIAWLNEDPGRLAQVTAEIRRQRAAAVDRTTTPTVGQAIAELAGAALVAPLD